MSGKTNKKEVSIEAKVKARARRQNIQHIILCALYGGTAVGLMMAAPNTVQLLKYVEKWIRPGPRLNRRLSQAVSRMVASGLMVREHSGSSYKLRLTAKGERIAEGVDTRKKILPRVPIRWDGKWRIIMFDVWERRHAVRDQLRTLLKRVGFVKIQGSVWVYPYDCEELHVFARSHFRLGKGMMYIVAEEIENDARLRKHFKLPKG